MRKDAGQEEHAGRVANHGDEVRVGVLRLMEEERYAQAFALLETQAQADAADLWSLGLHARLGLAMGQADATAALLRARMDAGTLRPEAINCVLEQSIDIDPGSRELAVRAGADSARLLEWLGERANPERPLSADEKALVKRLMLSPAGAAARSVHPAYRLLCREFPGTNIIVLSDSTVTTCCKDSRGENVFASLKEKTFADIWSSDVAAIADGDLYDLPLCRSCAGSPKAPLRSSDEDYEKWREALGKDLHSVTIEVMGACNYACCIGASVADHRVDRQVKPDLDGNFEAIRGKLPQIGRLRLFNFGEPLLHPGFVDFIRKCRAASPQTSMLISSNAMLLTEEIAEALVEVGVEHLVVSVHGGPGTENMLRYSRRGADYDKVLHNVARLLEIRRDRGREFPKIGLRSILFSWNDSEELMDRFRADARAMGLSPNWGHYSTDNYHWIHDCNGMGERASARFRPGSKNLQELLESREFFAPKRFEESATGVTCCSL